MINVLIYVIDLASKLLFWLVILKIVLSYFMDPFHPFRQTIDRLVEPLLLPIRRVVPPLGMVDFSPMILIILVELLASLLRNLLFSLII